MGRAPTTSKKSEDRDDEGYLILRGELFWKWKAVHEAVQRCDAEIKLRTPLIDQMLDAQPDLKRLIGERTAFISQGATMRAEYKQVLAALEAHFGFSMSNVSIDDITGRVHRLEEAAPAAPTKNGVNGHATTTPAEPAKKPKKRK